MNEIKIKVSFTKRTCVPVGVPLTVSDYNSTKMVFEFDREDGVKIFEMVNPSGNLSFVKEITNNEVILVGKTDITTVHEEVTYIQYKDSSDNIYWYDKENEKLYDSEWTEVSDFDLDNYTKQIKDCSLFTEAGNYTFEISLYNGDSKLSSASNKLKVKAEAVEIDGEVVETYLPIFDDLLTDVSEALNEVEEATAEANNLNLDVSKSGKVATVTLTKKDNTTKVVTLSDGTSLMFNWDGTKLGIKTDEESEYTYVDLKGATGDPGNGISSIDYNLDYTLTIHLDDGTSVTTGNLRGEKGATGDPGATGATGNGISKIEKTSTSGLVDTYTITYTNGNNTTFTVTNGNGISSISKTSTSGLVDTYTITFTNGNTTTFNVSNGKGISSIVKTSTSGLVDTYTITYNDGTTSTYTVTNGEDGEVTQAQLDETNAEVERAKMIYNAMPKASGSGEVISLDGTAECPLYEIGLNGNTSQDSTTGKNLLPYPYSEGTTSRNGITFTVNDDGSIKINGTASATTYIDLFRNTSNNLLTIGQTYTFSITPENANLRLAFYERYNDTWNDKGFGPNKITFTVKSDSAGQLIRLLVNNGSAITTPITVYPQIEQGSTQTSWERYTGKIASPNPSYPQDIHVVSGDNNVKIENKNLAGNFILGALDSNGAYYYRNDRYVTEDYISIKPSTHYKFSTNETTQLLNYCFYDKNKTFILNGTSSGPVSPNNAYYLKAYYDDTIYNNKLQIEENTSITSYIAHQEQNYPINLPSGMELCNIPNTNYKDRIFHAVNGNTYYDSLSTEQKNTLTYGKWYLHKEIGKVDLSTITFNKNSHSISGFSRYSTTEISNIKYVSQNTQLGNGLATKYRNHTGSGMSGTGSENCFAIDTAQMQVATLSTENPSGLFYYQLNTPTNTEITDTTLITQLNNLEKALSYAGQTNISQVNNDLAFKIDASAIRDLSGIFELIGE